jgi:hypothetical protein
MVLCDPIFYLAIKPVRLSEYLLRFGLRGDLGEGVVDSISLPSTRLKIVGVLVCGFTQH